MSAARQLVILLAGLTLALAAPAAAQTTTGELTGTYVRYVAVSPHGTMLANDAPDGRPCTAACTCDPAMTSCVSGRGMRYAPDGTDATLSCDAFYPSSVETFTVIAARGDGSILRGHNNLGLAPVAPLEGASVSDRTIHWAGVLRDAAGLDALRVSFDWRYPPDDHVVQLVAAVTNVGAVPVFDLFLMRNADPDFSGVCPTSDIGSLTTANDVVRQPPAGGDALATAESGGIVLGIGAHDDRARAHVGGHENTDAVGEWNSPHDTDGAVANLALDLIFHEGELAPGDTTTFEMFYVWGASALEVQARFDAVGAGGSTCAGVADGIGCSTISGANGVCHASICCTGCWDAAAGRCETGSSGAARCGRQGGACASCDDGALCTSDVCAMGACTHPPAPVGTACEDGSFCTTRDGCDGSAHCLPGVANTCDDAASCTTDSCDETADACRHALTGGCLIGGECVADAARARAYPCLVCDPVRTSSDWSAVASGASCGPPYCTSGVRFEGGTCDGAGACAAASHASCPTGVCASDRVTCAPPCTATSCPDGQRCADTMRCVALSADGEACAADDECSSTHCTDGLCCEEACDGTCAACNLPHDLGHCVGIPTGTDPTAECPGVAVCDGHGACTGGPADAGVHDGGVRVDAAAAPPDAPARCACTAAGSARGGGWSVLWMVLGVALARRRRLLSPLIACALLLVPTLASAITLTDALDYHWDVSDTPGGGGFILNGSSNAYDRSYVLAVAGSLYAMPAGESATLSADGRQLDFPPMTVGSTGLVAERHVYVPSDAAWARFIEVVTNPTASAVAARVTVSGNLGSDTATSLIDTSSGDVTLDASDTWFTTDDGDAVGSPSLAHVMAGPGGAVGVTGPTLVVDQITYGYDVMVPAHGRVAILHFAVQSSSRALARGVAVDLSTLPPEARRDGDRWATAVVNWSVSFTDTCATASEGAACVAWADGAGVCHGGVCCVGCWDGRACLNGHDVASCGIGGAVCTSCDDGNACTDEVCRGTCSNPASATTRTCDDGRYCTSGDHCDGASACVAGSSGPCDDRMSCTIDTCDETTHACTNVFGGGCIIGGECVGVGEHHLAYPCLVCDPARDGNDWSRETTGSVCAHARCEAGHLFLAGTCDAAGTCVSPRPTACASMTCRADGTCEPTCTATSCPGGQRCDADLHCVPVIAMGLDCAEDVECETGFCADGLCCDRACTGSCEACDLPGRSGRCGPVSASTDPQDECPGARTCDGHGACTGSLPDAGSGLDGGIDAEAPADAGSDAAVTPPASAGCGCSTQGRGPSPAWAIGLALALLVSRRARAW